MADPSLPPELSDLIDRLAHHHRGLALLHQAYMESAAVTLGVHPFVVEAARAYLATPSGRAALIEEVKRVQHRAGAGAGGPVPPPAGEAAQQPKPCREAEELIRAARERPQGVSALTAASPEEVAGTFGVHTYIVFRALGILERQGAATEETCKGS